MQHLESRLLSIGSINLQHTVTPLTSPCLFRELDVVLMIYLDFAIDKNECDVDPATLGDKTRTRTESKPPYSVTYILGALILRNMS